MSLFIFTKCVPWHCYQRSALVFSSSCVHLLTRSQECCRVYQYTRAGVDENGQHWPQRVQKSKWRNLSEAITTTESFQFWKDSLYYENGEKTVQYGCTSILPRIHEHCSLELHIYSTVSHPTYAGWRSFDVWKDERVYFTLRRVKSEEENKRMPCGLTHRCPCRFPFSSTLSLYILPKVVLLQFPKRCSELFPFALLSMLSLYIVLNVVPWHCNPHCADFLP